MDVAITITLIETYTSVTVSNRFSTCLAFIGRHSMNIFLFHTFIFCFWFRDFIYASRNPIIIFSLLLGICLIISIVLEYIKKYTIYRLMKK